MSALLTFNSDFVNYLRKNDITFKTYERVMKEREDFCDKVGFWIFYHQKRQYCMNFRVNRNKKIVYTKYNDFNKDQYNQNQEIYSLIMSLVDQYFSFIFQPYGHRHFIEKSYKNENENEKIYHPRDTMFSSLFIRNYLEKNGYEIETQEFLRENDISGHFSIRSIKSYKENHSDIEFTYFNQLHIEINKCEYTEGSNIKEITKMIILHLLFSNPFLTCMIKIPECLLNEMKEIGFIDTENDEKDSFYVISIFSTNFFTGKKIILKTTRDIIQNNETIQKYWQKLQ